MLIALFTILFLGSGSATQLLGNISEVQDRVKIVMPKDDQRSQALSVLKTMEKRTKSRNKMVKDNAKQMRRELEDHGVTDADIDAVWNDYVQGVGEFHRDMIDLRFELKQHISREEWQQVFGRG
jgi:predicted AAA+ superfamily ATPase